MAADLINKLRAEGWQPQFTASGSRLEEALENYRGLGFEVKTIPVAELQNGECDVCFDDEHDQSMMIFTRKSAHGQIDEIFDTE